MVAGIRETAHVALEVQQTGMLPSKAEQKTTKNKTEVDKEQVWENNKCRKAVFKILEAISKPVNQKKPAPQEARCTNMWQGKNSIQGNGRKRMD